MRISPQAAERVTKAARELGYRPSLLARGLRTNLSQTIGFISDVVATEPYAGDLIRGSMFSAVRHQRLILIGESEGDAEVETQLVESMLDRGVDGFIYATMFTREAQLSTSLRSRPLVLLNCLSTGEAVSAVVPDERGAGRSAAHALLEAGHREGIYVVGESPGHVVAAVERVGGVEDELSGAGVRLAGHIESLWWPDSAHAAVSEFLGAGTRPAALICLNDRIAFGAYQAVTEAGLRIPDAVSVVSFDDSDLASWLRPQLTSIEIPHFELGRHAIELLLGGERTPTVHRLPMRLHERASIAPPG